MQIMDDFVHISFRREAFQVAFAQPFCFVFPPALLFAEMIAIWAGHREVALLLVALPLLVSALCVTAILFLQHRYKFALSRQGIKSYNFLCRPQQTNWDDVEDVRLIRTAGLNYLQILTRSKSSAIWLPLFVRRESVLKRMMLTYLHTSGRLYRKLDELLA